MEQSIRKRSAWLTAFLVILLIGCLGGALRYLYYTVSRTSAQVPEWIILACSAGFILNIIFILAVLNWKRWGVFGLGAGYLFISVMHQVVGPSTVLALRDLIIIILFFVFLRPVWKYLE